MQQQQQQQQRRSLHLSGDLRFFSAPNFVLKLRRKVEKMYGKKEVMKTTLK